mmetsp:Transcript_112249/g.194531  ORF Transcript_112249/g.194531 Transcript_112249/m.194531 type:complete len:199 (-) Transcript_112249:24-620(-)
MGFGDTSAKDKKASAAKAKASAESAAKEDASWAESDKKLNKKAARAEEKDAKADEKLARKAELRELEEAENATVSKMKGANKGSSKMTQAEIARRSAMQAALKGAAPKKSSKSTTVDAPKLEANTNRTKDVADGTGIDGALSAMEGAAAPKKMTYKQFEDLQLPGIREENPELKLQQAKDRCFKLWERAPENPKNQEK